MANDERDWLPSPRARASIVKRLRGAASTLTDAALADMRGKFAWIDALEPEYRSWINLLVRSGVDAFIAWFEGGADPMTPNIFEAAPRPLQRHISLHQTVDLIRSTIATVERQINTVMPRGDRAICSAAILRYSREVAFDAAEVYARAAESRGAWDARNEAMVVDAVVRGELDQAVTSRAATLGWGAPVNMVAIVGDVDGADERALRRLAEQAGVDVLAAPQGTHLVALLGGAIPDEAAALALGARVAGTFGPGPVVVGPVVGGLAGAASSARSALSGRRCADAWPQAPRPVAASDLLPERALSGDGHARRALARDVFGALTDAGGELVETLEAYLDAGSIEAAARRLYVHANTVRYRLGKVEEVTGFSATNARDSYALRLGVSLGRIIG